MAKWKELGEVPDSDDESGFDSSQELEHESEHDLPLQQSGVNISDEPVVEGPALEDQNVWDIPLSSQVSKNEHNVTRSSPRPQSPQLPQAPSELATIHYPDSSPLSSLPPLEPRGDPEDSTKTAETSKVELNGPRVSDVISPSLPKQFVNAIFEVDVPEEGEEDSIQEAVRSGRSLRPRKPIQEHPYLLESAQYSKTLKSHGVRPLRMQIEEAARRRREEEDSQEQDYEDESQSTVRELAQEDSGDSQTVQHPDLLGISDLPDLPEDADMEGLSIRSPSPLPGRRGAEPNIFLGSSQDDELPDPADTAKWKLGKRPTMVAKRQASPKASGKRKLPKLHQPVRFAGVVSPRGQADSVFNVPPSPPQTSPSFMTRTSVTNTERSRPVTTLTPNQSSTISSRNQSPALVNESNGLIDLIMIEDGDELDSGQDAESSDSESDTEVARVAMRRKMRGVLPASWLRLDQPGTRRKSPQDIPQRSPEHSPERTQRKGVAQRRQVSPRPGADAALFLDSDDDDDVTLRAEDLHEFNNNNNNIPIFEDDAGSVIEDDSIDYMLSGNKRARTDTDGLERPKKRRKNQQTTFKGYLGQQKRQQRITGLLSRTKSTTTRPNAKRRDTENNSGGRRHTKGLSRAVASSTPPPQLSILDVVEPNAPPFIRIAARTANRRSDKGRSSPSKKHIALGTREDNIDATSILRDWKRGRIKPKITTSASTRSQIELPKPLRSLSYNSVTQPPKVISKPRNRVVPSGRFSQPRRMVKQASIDNFMTVETGTSSTHTQLDHGTSLPKRSQLGRTNSLNAASRPAQLEAVGEQIGRHAFDARKRALDALYRKSRRELPTPARIGLERLIGRNLSSESSNKHTGNSSSGDGPERLQPATGRKRLKFRKHFQPQHVDTTAPQYAHANDPLPREVTLTSPIAEVVHASESAGKLLGLGPFGTHYTQHFEIFPLELGVFFHESTVLGSGRLVKALDEKSRDSFHHPRGRAIFVLGEKTLRWGQWDAQTSSELGIVLDWIVEYLHSESPDISWGITPVQAADFVLEYFQDHISFSDEESEKHFAGRALETLQTFVQRLEILPLQSQDQARPLIDVMSRGLVISFQTLRICHSLSQLSETFQLEDVLGKMAKRAARELLARELADIRNLYHDLQRIPLRERGIRNEQYSVTCWVILIRVLEESRIPRSGFWDIVSSVISSTDLNSVNDAHTFERIWYDLFTLLPLGEFDSSGVVVPGTRHTIPLEGWVLPQKLLRRVFQLYESNSRQAPSFNDYCRGVVGRCHYLVEQWGWRKSNGIIGTIFDFFAARGLSHLRNEEVYKSPEFLEHLAASPSLAIVPEDRCFHIFLKLLALSIKRLENHGLTKDARNMLARVLPNHNRQYEKEKDIHESELAALRNHHDLLCTLYWAAPPSLRPSVQTIEKLILPGSSHKEACLIGLRAWGQLSRFVISSEEDTYGYKPFADWQKNIFQHAIEQYLSAESDIQQQLLNMSKDVSRNISRDMVNAVVRLNRKGAMDVIHFSMKGFLSVIRLAPTLGAVSFALNHYQLEQVFTRFPFTSADFDWSSLRVALDIVEYYVTRVEEFFSQGLVSADHSWHGEDAIMLVERKIATPFVSMIRTIIGMEFKDLGLGPTSDRSICMEQAVLLSGRLAARLTHARLLRVSQFFTSGKYSLFQTTPKAIDSPSRKYHTLFLAMLIEQDVDDFKDLGGSILDLFLKELVKPWKFLAYENRLALAIKRHGDPYLKDAVIEGGNSPDYNSNRALFSHTVAMMRKTLRFVETNQKQQLLSQFSKALKSTMDQMKLDLKSITLDSSEHMDYIEFVRSIVTVIRSQDLCPVDSYFYQISREYSPSSQDPRLQIAGILSWGLKLEEGDNKATPGLFYLLFPNFKLALANGKLGNERAILQQGMGNIHVSSFVLSKMLPAIIKTAFQVPTGWIILDTYVSAFEALLTAPCIYREMGREDMSGLLVVLKIVLASIGELRTLDATALHDEYIYTLIQTIHLLNLLSPSLTAYLINEPTSEVAIDITEAVETFTKFTREAGNYVSNLLNNRSCGTYLDIQSPVTMDSNRFFQGLQRQGVGFSIEPDEHITRFANHMVRDIKENWVSNGSTISVRGPSRAQGHTSTQSGQGTLVPRWDSRMLMQALNKELREWNYANDLAAATSRLAGLPLDEFLF
ncbi:Mus7/MMS22 family-domain-containing protein [Daldinia decipiens]|uniref:Mus7/MMS22 family-domain-containing protein n=1 Tax=Daldinia decipiens TaxID=326647 RepID=UPI0020C5533F|nr:Mus7/MMS22 family-domain-containing protein [Daldinia decipiens]KAI1657379.1 Mus7/MMS22 family-domain-containing protein [Daldinia decipiens]